MAEPYPKTKQLARGERRYRRKVASPKQWQAIIAAKAGPCRVCDSVGTTSLGPLEYHHLVARALGGDDAADNIVPLCRGCHMRIEARTPYTAYTLAHSLTDAEYAYIIGKLGEGAMGRLFGV